MSRKTRFVFEGFPLANCVGKLVLERDCSDVELQNPGTADIVVTCDYALLIQWPSLEEILEDEDTGASVCSQMEFRMLDTFEEGFLRTDARYLGGRLPANERKQVLDAGATYDDKILSRATNYSLFDLVAGVDEVSYLIYGVLTPPSKLLAYWHTKSATNPRAVMVVNFELTDIDEEFIWGDTVRGQYLINSRQFYRYDAAEKTVHFVGNDKNKIDLESMKFSDRERAPDYAAYPASEYAQRSQVATLYDLPLADHYPYPASGKQISWSAFAVHEFVQNIYNLIFSDGWINDSEQCEWKFHCASIPTTAWNNPGFGGSGYTGNLVQREEQSWAATDHNVTTKFNVARCTGSDEYLFFHASFIDALRQHTTTKNRRYDMPFAFYHYPNAWDAVTRIASSTGYWTRYSWKNGMRRVQHIPKRRQPKMLKIPAALKSQQTPFSQVDAMEVTPYQEFGKVFLSRRFHNNNHYLKIDDFGQTGLSQALVSLIEPALAGQWLTLKWDNSLGYYNGETADAHAEPRYKPFHQPYPNTIAKNPVKRTQVFGVFGNFRVGVTYWDFGDFTSGVLFGTISEPFWVIVGTNADRSIMNDDMGVNFDNPYPGLILYAGTSADGGKTVNPAPLQPVFFTVGGGNYYRGCGAISVPYGDPNADGTYNYITCYSAADARAVFDMQFALGKGSDVRKLTLPTTYEYENDYGETGDEAIYPSLGIQLYKRTYIATRTKIMWDSDTVEIDCRGLAPILPTPTPLDTPIKYQTTLVEDSGKRRDA